MDNQQEETVISLKDLLNILKKHFRMILIASLICGICGFGIAKYMLTPIYRAEASLIVNPSETTQATITYDQVSLTRQLVATYAFILKSDTVLSQVIDNLQLDMNVEQLAERISVEEVNDTEVIQIFVRNEDPEMAVKIVNSIIEVAPAIIIQTIKAGSVEIISPASAEDAPVFPNVLLITAIATCAAFFLAICFGLLREILNNKFSSDEDIQKILNLTVLGVIPNYESK